MKLLIILSLMAVLSGCSIMDKFSSGKSTKKVVIEDKGQNEIPAIIGEQSSFEWQESQEKLVASLPKQEKERILSALEASDVSFTLYFDFNADEISKDATQEIIKHVQFMQDNPQIRLHLEGHADARGTREYNLALAENRALRVKEVMSLYHIADRIKVISYGEEKPISKIDNEIGWQKNRRVEFVYE